MPDTPPDTPKEDSHAEPKTNKDYPWLLTMERVSLFGVLGFLGLSILTYLRGRTQVHPGVVAWSAMSIGFALLHGIAKLRNRVRSLEAEVHGD